MKCAHCEAEVEIDEIDFELECHGLESFVQCIPCKKAEDACLREIGLGDCIIQKKAFKLVDLTLKLVN